VLGGNVYLGGWFVQGSAHTSWDNLDYRASVSIGTILETLLRPVFAGASFNGDGRLRFKLA
jgi:hypothetical protein